MSSPIRNLKHFEYIDALRGIAFLGVLTVHSTMIVGPFPGRGTLIRGDLGVQLFFLVSAITLCYSMSAREKKESRPITFFYIRRLFRIAPFFWLAILFYGAFPNIIPDYWLDRNEFAVHWYYFPAVALFIHGWHPNLFNSIVPGGWSIAVEMTFYLVFPFLFRLISTVKMAVLAVVAGFGFAIVQGVLLNYFRQDLYPGTPTDAFVFFARRWFPSQLTVFLIGMLAYHLLRNPTVHLATESRKWSIGIFGAALPLFLIVIHKNAEFLAEDLLAVLLLGLMVIAASGGRIPFLANPVICYIGRISYSCYLVHFAALGLVFRILNIHINGALPIWDTGSKTTNLLLSAKVFFISLAIRVPIASLTLLSIENPGIALGRRFIKRLGRHGPAPAELRHQDRPASL